MIKNSAKVLVSANEIYNYNLLDRYFKDTRRAHVLIKDVNRFPEKILDVLKGGI